MTTSLAFRFWAPAVLFGAVSFAPLASTLQAQTTASATETLLSKAHSLELRGRMDMAAQTWQQVLLADPSNTEALAGLARAAKLSGNLTLSNTYLERLRSINPNDPGIARVETMSTQADHNAQLANAGRLAQQGQYAQAMEVYRQIYGATPPEGDPALAFYETEAATEEGRPHAIAGLRGLVAKYPADSRYQVALGRILSYNPRSRAEGRKLLAAHPGDLQAQEALRQSLLWDAQNPATAAEIKAYLAHHDDAQLDQVLRNEPRATGRPQTAEERAATAFIRSRSAENQAAYRDLNAKHLEDAEARFKAILVKTPNDADALAGMGYLRMQQANFGGAISYLVQAKQDGSKDPSLEGALTTSRFWYTMGEGAVALNANDLPAAEKNYRSALAMRSNSAEALEGLGGTLLKAQQPEPAIPIFADFVRLKPESAHAWRGLFLALDSAGKTAHALDVERQIPPAVRSELARDPLFLRALASAYASAGRDSDAQRVLKTALDLPFPVDAKGVEAETQLQYAGLLQQANRLPQAGGLYRQVLTKDPNNIAAWQGLVRVQHQSSEDPQALETLEAMPPPVYGKATRDAGFAATVASVYQAQGKLDIAQDILEKSIEQLAAKSEKPPIAMRIQLASVYLERNDPQQAYPIYQQVLQQYPDRTEAWKGLLNALHISGRDAEALTQAQQIPPAIRLQLENDVDFLQIIASVYVTLGDPKQAQVFLTRVQQHYAAQHTQAPADVDIQNAWLLYNAMNDTGLYHQLLTLGGRGDLTPAQRRTIQTIWANWAVRRANQAATAGDNSRALAILNATAASFPDNAGVIRALAAGYTKAGLPKQAILIWKAQNLTTATASDYKSAIGSALAANDQKDAETWLRFGLEQYPRDPSLLILGAKFEQARGDTARAREYYKASLSAMPPPDPGAELATQLGRPNASTTSRLPNSKSQNLASLLAPGPGDRTDSHPDQPVSSEPYLPGSVGAGSAPVQINPQPNGFGPNGQFDQPSTSVVPSYMTSPTPGTNPPAQGARTRLRDYVPQASNDEPLPADATALPVSVAATSFDQTTPVISQAGYLQHTLNDQPFTTQPVPQPAQSAPPPGQSASPPPQQMTQAEYEALRERQKNAQPGDQSDPNVPYQPPPKTAVQLGSSPPVRQIPRPEITDVLPTARYAPNAHPRPSTHVDNAAAAANAAAVRRRQQQQQVAEEPRSGESKPPVEDYTTDAPATQVQNRANPSPGGSGFGQQYPQPNTGSRAAASHSRTRSAKRSVTAEESGPPAPVEPARQPVYSGLSYPGVGQPLSYQPYPSTGLSYSLSPAPTDADLAGRAVPPLGGRYTGEALDMPNIPLTERQQTERDLAMLDASYSGWLGGTGSARYRSGTPGIDRLTDLEAVVEASATLGNSVRVTIVPRTVFLNNGTLNVGDFAGLTTNVPVIGTFQANAANAPAQQSVSGIGGELQVAGNRFAAAVGYTPYEFLVHNVTGRLLFKPSQHFTLYANRDSVVETQLSYAGLRDPGSISITYPGNIWGGVIATGGGARFDFGDERAGFYVSAAGSDLTGSHVLQNSKFEGSMGAYFLAHTFPGYGKLNVGVSLFGEHFAHNERGLTYGLGGYFSPNSYFLASVPITFAGRYGNNFHYTVAGAVGVQTFQEDSQIFFPLDRGLQTTFEAPCTIATLDNHTCASMPTNSNTGGNYNINAEGAYRIADHWYAGGFFSANDTNNYNTVTGGFFVRYLFRPQIGSDEYPTGLFPVEGFRPLRVP